MRYESMKHLHTAHQTHLSASHPMVHDSRAMFRRCSMTHTHIYTYTHTHTQVFDLWTDSCTFLHFTKGNIGALSKNKTKKRKGKVSSSS